jgi:hypothetical protein
LYRSIVAVRVTPIPPVPRPFKRTAVVFPRHRPPPSVKKAGSSSRKLHAPSEFFQPSPARCVSAPCAFLEVSSLLATPALRVHIPTGSHPAFVPPAAFLALSTAYSSDCLAGLFHPAATSRVSLQGFPPPNQPEHLVDAPSPLAVGAELLPAVSHQLQLSTRRPQGFPPVRDPQLRWGV